VDVRRVSITPVKGTALHHQDRVQIERHGAAGDRTFLFVDPETMSLASGVGRRSPLLRVLADHDAAADELRFILPDGSAIDGSAASRGAAVTVDRWGTPVAAHAVPGPWDRVASDLVGFPVILVRPDEPGGGCDEEPVTLVSLASVDELAGTLGVERIDPARFRMTIEITGTEPREEDELVGQTIRIGGARLSVVGRVPRCVVTTWDPATGERDLDTLRGIRQLRGRTPDGLPFGIYARVTEPGEVAVGDAIVLDQGSGTPVTRPSRRSPSSASRP
jgi:uncharacterized protein YcbX